MAALRTSAHLCCIPRRLEHAQTDWDILHGLLMACRAGDISVARAYLDNHAAEVTVCLLDLLAVWSQEMDDQAQHRDCGLD